MLSEQAAARIQIPEARVGRGVSEAPQRGLEGRMSYRDDVATITKELSEEEKQAEMLAMFLVNEFHLLPSNPENGRFSGGHKWGRASEREREVFRTKARRMLSVL